MGLVSADVEKDRERDWIVAFETDVVGMEAGSGIETDRELLRIDGRMRRGKDERGDLKAARIDVQRVGRLGRGRRGLRAKLDCRGGSEQSEC